MCVCFQWTFVKDPSLKWGSSVGLLTEMWISSVGLLTEKWILDNIETAELRVRSPECSVTYDPKVQKCKTERDLLGKLLGSRLVSSYKKQKRRKPKTRLKNSMTRRKKEEKTCQLGKERGILQNRIKNERTLRN